MAYRPRRRESVQCRFCKGWFEPKQERAYFCHPTCRRLDAALRAYLLADHRADLSRDGARGVLLSRLSALWRATREKP